MTYPSQNIQKNQPFNVIIIVSTVFIILFVSSFLSFIFYSKFDVKLTFSTARIMGLALIVVFALPGYAKSQPGADEISAMSSVSWMSGRKFDTSRAKANMSEYGSSSDSWILFTVGAIATVIFSHFVIKLVY